MGGPCIGRLSDKNFNCLSFGLPVQRGQVSPIEADSTQKDVISTPSYRRFKPAKVEIHSTNHNA